MSADTRRVDAALSNPGLQTLLRDLETAHAADRPALLRKIRELCVQLRLSDEDYDALLVTWAKGFGLRAETALRRLPLLAEARAEAKTAEKAGARAELEEPSVIEEDALPEPLNLRMRFGSDLNEPCPANPTPARVTIEAEEAANANTRPVDHSDAPS